MFTADFKYKKMNKIAGFVIVSMTLMTVNVSCQSLENREKGGKQQISKMNQKLKSELGLDESQELSWNKIYKNYTVKFKDLRSDESMDREIKKEKAKRMFAELDKEVLSILNDDQQKEYTELVKQNRAMAKDRYQKGQGENSGQRNEQNKGQGIKNELNLSEDQSEKWDEIIVDYRTKMQDLRNNDESSEAKRNDIENLMGEKNAEILAILDSGQQASYLKIVEERRKQAKERKNKSQ